MNENFDLRKSITDLNDFDLTQFLASASKKEENKKSKEDKLESENSLFGSLLDENDLKEIENYKKSLENEEIDLDFDNLNYKDKKEFKSSVEGMKLLKKATEPMILIKPDIWFNDILNQDTQLRKYLESKGLDYKWLGKDGVITSVSTFKKILYIVIRYLTGIKITFDLNCDKRNRVYIDNIASYKLTYYSSRSKTSLDISSLVFNPSPYKLAYFCLNEKYFVNTRKYNSEQEDEDFINSFSIREEIIKYKIKRRKELSKVSYISIEDINKLFGWDNNLSEYLEVLTNLGYLYIDKDHHADPYIDELHVNMINLESEDSLIPETKLFINKEDLDRVLSKFKISSDDKSRALNLLLNSIED